MNQDLALFLDLSAHLTGFSVVELQATGMAKTYLNAAAAGTPDDWRAFLECAATVLREGRNDEARTHALIARELFPKALFGGLAQNITFMWYSGQWAPTVDASGANLATVTNVSAQAYVQGLMWTAAHTHPPGAKQPGFASWARIPPSAR
jgi:hypothetical protein